MYIKEYSDFGWADLIPIVKLKALHMHFRLLSLVPIDRQNRESAVFPREIVFHIPFSCFRRGDQSLGNKQGLAPLILDKGEGLGLLVLVKNYGFDQFAA